MKVVHILNRKITYELSFITRSILLRVIGQFYKNVFSVLHFKLSYGRHCISCVMGGPIACAFIGPYETLSNEVSFRISFAQVHCTSTHYYSANLPS